MSDARTRTQATYDGPGCVAANQLFKARIVVQLGCEIVTGGRLVLATRHVSDMGDPQVEEPHSENYIRVICSQGDTTWSLLPANDWSRHPWNRGISLQLAEGRMPVGSQVAVDLGMADEGCPGYRCQSFAEEDFHFRLGIDPDGSGDWMLMDPEMCPGFRIVGSIPVALKVRVVDPTGPQLRIAIKPEDAHGNVAGYRLGKVLLSMDDRHAIGEMQVEADRPAVLLVNRPEDEEWHHVTVSTESGSVWARSNPFGPSPVPGRRLFFGEIHAQSALCDGTNQPAQLYRYARYAAGLDFAAVTSHDMELTQSDWHEIMVATAEAHAPGSFVTFLGYEWSGPTERGGDHNIYFPTGEGPLIANGPWPGDPKWDAAEGEWTEDLDLAQTIEKLRPWEPMIIPHVGGRCCNFDYYDPELMPLFEMHSCHRNHEHVALEAIRRGLRVGFIGGSDDHRGAPGDSVPAARERFFSTRSGLVAVYAEELTREALWRAFFERRTYATNGSRMAVDFTVNGTPMGGELSTAPGDTLAFRMWGRLDGLLDRVELVRNTETIQRFVIGRNRVPEFEFEHEEPAPSEPTAYYMRVLQEDGGAAWTSPVWVDPAE